MEGGPICCCCTSLLYPPFVCGWGGNSLRRSLECISLSYTCSHQDNKKFRVALDTKHKMQVSSVLTEDHFMLSHDALGILNCYPQSPRDSQLKKKAHSHSPISKDQGQLPQCLVTRTGHCKPSSWGQQLWWVLGVEAALCQCGPTPGAGIGWRTAGQRWLCWIAPSPSAGGRHLYLCSVIVLYSVVLCHVVWNCVV